MPTELSAMYGGGERAGRLFAWVDIPPEDTKELGAAGVQALADTGRAQAAALCIRLECAIDVSAHTSGGGVYVSAECNGLICTRANNNNAVVKFCDVARQVLVEAGMAIVENGQTMGAEQQHGKTSAGAD